MLNWLHKIAYGYNPPTSARAYVFDSPDPTVMMSSLMVDEIEGEVKKIMDFNEEEDTRKLANQSDEDKQEVMANYSWLIDTKFKERKTLSIQEISDIEAQCLKIHPNEWNILSKLWKGKCKSAKCRNDIISFFNLTISEVIANRLQIDKPRSLGDDSYRMTELISKESNSEGYFNKTFELEDENNSNKNTDISILSVENLSINAANTSRNNKTPSNKETISLV